MRKAGFTMISLNEKDMKVDGNEAFWETLDVEEILLVPDALLKQQCIEPYQVNLCFESMKVYLGVSLSYLLIGNQ